MIRKEVRIANGETVKVTNKWAAECEERGASVSSSSWEACGFTLESPALASNVATVLITASAESFGLLKNTVVLSNGEVLIADRDVFCY